MDIDELLLIEFGLTKLIDELNALLIHESFLFDELNALLIHESFVPVELGPQTKSLESHLIDFQTFFTSAVDSEKKLDALKTFSEEISTSIIKAKNVIVDFMVQAARQKKKKRSSSSASFKKFGIFFDDLKARRTAIKLESIKINLESLLNKLREAQLQTSCLWKPPLTNAPPPPPPTHDDMVGRKEEMKRIQEKLLSDDPSLLVISIVGIQGIGKTAMARRICNNEPVKTRFDFLAWISYDRSHTTQKFEGAGGLGCIRGSLSSLLNEKRYLIVMDNVSKDEACENLMKALQTTKTNGSRVLLITGDTRIATRRRSQFIEPLGPLSEEESWELFIKKVCPHPLPDDLFSIGKNIVGKCDGLPFAIEHLVDHLSKIETNVSEWSKVLESCSNKPLDNEYQTPWSYIVDMITKDLPLHLKRCLFYFGLFPKRIKLPVRRLIALWVAEGFVEPEDNNSKTLECIAEEYLLELINLNMIQVVKYRSNGRPKKCCLANYLREHLLTRAKQVNCATSDESSSTSRTTVIGVRRLADHPDEDSETVASLDSSKILVSLLSFDYRDGSAPGEKIRDFLYGGITQGCFQLLRVLDLECVYKPGLPKEMGRLIHLRYLGLRWTYLDTLPSFVGDLTNLQTLDVKHTYINTLPNSIWKLRKLRHLSMNESYQASFVHRPNDGYMENLQTLWGIFIDEESPLKNALDRFTKLTRLGLACHLTSESNKSAMANWILKLKDLQSLRLISKDRLGKISSVPKLKHFTDHTHLSDIYLLGRLEKLFEVTEFPPKLTELTLSASKLEEDPMKTLEKLPNLSILRLYSGSYIGENMVCSSSGFMHLEVLKIWKLENIKEWIIEEGAMPVLKSLEIRSCSKLEMLPVGLHQLTTLQELKLTGMPETFIIRVKVDQNKDWYKKAGVHFVDFDGQEASTPSSSSSPLLSFGSLFLVSILLGRLPASPTRQARVKGLPALTYRR